MQTQRYVIQEVSGASCKEGERPSQSRVEEFPVG